MSYLNGLYKSQYLGTGLEFSELREYSYGDDIRTIDWKASAKSTKTYVKKYNDHKNQDVIFAIDGSSSMLIDSDNESATSLFLASKLINLLMQLALNNNDKVRFYTSVSNQGYITPPVSQRTHLISWLMRTLYLINTSPNNSLDWAPFLKDIRHYVQKPSLIIVISDTFTVDKSIAQQFRMLKASKHKIWCIRTTGSVISSSITPESGQLADIETRELLNLEIIEKKSYEIIQAELASRDEQTASTIKSLGIPYHALANSEPLVPEVIKILKQAKRLK